MNAGRDPIEAGSAADEISGRLLTIFGKQNEQVP